MFSPNLELKGLEIVFHGVPSVKPVFRTVRGLKPVITECDLPEEEIIYAVYRDVKDTRHAGLFKRHSLRFDITAVFPKILGIEYPKTLGHYHSLCRNVSYTEVYEVLSGVANFILQKVNGNIVTDIVSIKAKEGDVVIIPPDYGHVTVNPGKKILVVSNLQSSLAKADYDSIINLKGAAYFLTTKGLIKNPNYVSKELRAVKAKNLKEEFFLSTGQLYEIFLDHPEKFDFLNNPESHLKMLSTVI